MPSLGRLGGKHGFDFLWNYTLKRERRAQTYLETAPRHRRGGSFVLSYRPFALRAGFERPNFAAVSSCHFVSSRELLVLYVLLGGFFVVPFRWCALGVRFGRYPN